MLWLPVRKFHCSFIPVPLFSCQRMSPLSSQINCLQRIQPQWILRHKFVLLTQSFSSYKHKQVHLMGDMICSTEHHQRYGEPMNLCSKGHSDLGRERCTLGSPRMIVNCGKIMGDPNNAALYLERNSLSHRSRIHSLQSWDLVLRCSACLVVWRAHLPCTPNQTTE